VKVGDSCDVPRVASQGACEEGAGVVDKVGEDQFYEFLRKPGDWGRVQGRGHRATSKEQTLDFGHAPPPDLGSEQFGRYG